MKLRIKVTLSALLICLISACSGIDFEKNHFDDGYQFGDVTKEILRLQVNHCREADEDTRLLADMAIRYTIQSKLSLPIDTGKSLCDVDLVTLLGKKE